MNNRSGLLDLACLITLATVISGCAAWRLPFLPNPSAVGASEDTQASTDVEAEPTSVRWLEDSENLQLCIEDLENPQFLQLHQALSALPEDSGETQTSYYVAFSTFDGNELVDMRQVQELRTIATMGDRCQILSQAESEGLAKQLLEHIHNDVITLYQGDIEAAWSNIVNRWEQDHAVSGSGDHPLLLAIEDIWMARTLDLPLPDYIPIHISEAI
ncbi:MAG: hypothetical protein AAFX01_12850 [Cyanobacteria bacterium J06638_28]